MTVLTPTQGIEDMDLLEHLEHFWLRLEMLTQQRVAELVQRCSRQELQYSCSSLRISYSAMVMVCCDDTQEAMGYQLDVMRKGGLLSKL